MKTSSNERRGYLLGVVSTLALAIGLAVVPAQAQIPQIEFGACGPMDVVFVIDTTNSMDGAIQNIKDDLTTPITGIIDTITNAAGDDGIPDAEARLGLVVVNGFGHPTFDGTEYDCSVPDQGVPMGGVGDCIVVLEDLGVSSILDVQLAVDGLSASNGGPTPEITAEALRTIIEQLPQTPGMVGASPNVTPPAQNPPDGWPRLQWNGWTGTFEPAAKKIVFLLTDNLPGGTDSSHDGADAAQAAAMATAYSNAGITIQPVLVAVPLCLGGSNPNAEISNAYSEQDCEDDGGVVGEGSLPAAKTIMQAYADATGGTLSEVPASGEGTALSIISIIENCGEIEEKEGRMTGGGSIFNEDDRSNGRTTHGFTLHCDGGPNRLQVNWRGYRFHLEELEDAVCTDNPELDEENPVSGFDTMTGTGYGRLNGVSGAKVEFEFTDDGEPGNGVDTAKIIITPAGGGLPVLDTFGTLQRGNHQAHPEN